MQRHGFESYPAPMAPRVNPDSGLIDASVNQLSTAGRNILKTIEEYKFKVDQVKRILHNNPAFNTLLEQKEKNLDAAANEIYQLVFSIENIDITNVANQLPDQPTPHHTPPSVGATPQGPTVPEGGAPAPQPNNGPPTINTQTVRDQNSAMPADATR